MTVKKSLFIQVQWYDKADLVKHLEHVYREHRDRGKDDYIHNVVLDEIGDGGGIHPNMNLILPYLPGGDRRCFDNVFVGSHFIKWPGPGNAYQTGMLNEAHRWINLSIQRKLWRQFKDYAPHVPFHLYINHEGVLDHFDEPKIREAYEAYLIQSARDAHHIRPYAAVLWAPAIWSRKPLTYRERKGIKRTFKNVAAFSNGRGITWLHLQDMQGRKYPPRLWVVKRWYNQLKDMELFASLRIDMEFFRYGGGLRADSLAAIKKREAYYKKYGIPVGASWELRWWFESHVDV